MPRVPTWTIQTLADALYNRSNVNSTVSESSASTSSEPPSAEDREQSQNLEDVITSYHQVLTLQPPGHPSRSSSLDGLANAVLTCYEQSGRMEDLDEAITYYREALTLRPIGHPYRSSSLLNLANAVFARYQQLGRMEDVEEVITYNSEILTLCLLDHPYHSISLNNLAGTVLIRYEQYGRMEDLEHAITYNLKALIFRPLAHPDRSSSLLNLTKALFARYQQLGRMEDLEEVITYNFEVLLLCHRGHRHHPISLSNLAAAFLTRYQQSGRIEDLEYAITYNRKALILRPLGHSHHSISLDNLASTVLIRYEQSGRMEDLEDAITYNREALTLRPFSHPLRSSSLNNLANAVLTRFKQSGKIEDLEDAIAYNSEALTLRPLGHPDRSSSLINLANTVVARYQQLGRKEHLEEAITYYCEALTLQALGHPGRSVSLNNLANVVSCRFERLGRVADLEDAITYNREALTLRPPGHPDRCSSLINLANAVFRRYGQLSSMEDLEEATTYYHEALTLTLRSIGHPLHASSLNNVANAVLARYQHSDMIEDLEEAITYYCKALTLRPHGHSDRSSSLHNLAYAVLARYQQSSRMEHLEEAITYYREALDLSPLGRPNRFIPLSNLADAVLSRFRQSGMLKDLDESITLYEQAAHNSAASSKDRLAIAIRWARAAQRHRHSSVVDAYSTSLHCLDRCLISYPDVDSQQRFLASVHIPRSLTSNAASAAIDAKDLEAAVELLDQGRAILWSKMAGYRYPLDQLRKVNAQLADQLGGLSVQLEHLALSSESSGPINIGVPISPVHSEVQTQRYHNLSEEWDKVLEQIRKIDGFSNFLQAVPFSTLRTAAGEDPIILVNISKYRSDAIILHINKPPVLVALPNVQLGHLAHLSKQLALAQKSDTTNPSKLILPILRDLWDDIVSPVCECLTQLAVTPKRRIWWCPTSKLCALPLHAAGPYQPQQRNLPDMYISSYIPTISALISARNMVGQSIVPKLLLIGQPSETLLNVQDEIDNVRQLGDCVDVIVGIDANRDTVLRGLQQHSWAHFACHGHLGDNSQPFQASFELDGGSRLTLLDLIRARLPNAELAFLSACHSAAGDLSTPDETIHLAAALQFCGFRSVVGTMWAMEDRDGPTISKEFYKYMFRNRGKSLKVDFRDSAEALNVAIRTMRKNGVPLERWIMFVHIGA